jgi:hypothetical protein
MNRNFNFDFPAESEFIPDRFSAQGSRQVCQRAGFWRTTSSTNGARFQL